MLTKCETNQLSNVNLSNHLPVLAILLIQKFQPTCIFLRNDLQKSTMCFDLKWLAHVYFGLLMQKASRKLQISQKLSKHEKFLLIEQMKILQLHVK